jgi:hypothetical protein
LLASRLGELARDTIDAEAADISTGWQVAIDV